MELTFAIASRQIWGENAGGTSRTTRASRRRSRGALRTRPHPPPPARPPPNLQSTHDPTAVWHERREHVLITGVHRGPDRKRAMWKRSRGASLPLHPPPPPSPPPNLQSARDPMERKERICVNSRGPWPIKIIWASRKRSGGSSLALHPQSLPSPPPSPDLQSTRDRRREGP